MSLHLHLRTTQDIPASPDRVRAAAASTRLAYAALTALLLSALVFEVAEHGHWGAALAGLVAADLSLAFGAGAGLAPGQLHPRAVLLYNAVHRFWGPVILMGVASAGVLGLGWFILGLAWALHVALDRTVGYGLRDRDGHQRGR